MTKKLTDFIKIPNTKGALTSAGDAAMIGIESKGIDRALMRGHQGCEIITKL